jgi:hypothetical protein
MPTETVKFTFTEEYGKRNDIIDYYCEVNEDTHELNVIVNDVSDYTLSSMNEEELCEFFGMRSEYLRRAEVLC